MTSNQPNSQHKTSRKYKSQRRPSTIVVSDSDFKPKKNHKPKQQSLVVVAPPKHISATVNHTIGNPREIIYKF